MSPLPDASKLTETASPELALVPDESAQRRQSPPASAPPPLVLAAPRSHTRPSRTLAAGLIGLAALALAWFGWQMTSGSPGVQPGPGLAPQRADATALRQASIAAVTADAPTMAPPSSTDAKPRNTTAGSLADGPPLAPPAPPAPSIALAPGRRAMADDRLASAWQAWQAGQLRLAQAAFQQVLDQAPQQSQALHGLAAMALEQGQTDQARAYFHQALAANPQDAVALSALASLPAEAEPLLESRLNNLLASQANDASLYLGLGNLLARQGRWQEARWAYDQARAQAPNNPDLLFNLAVSLEQSHQIHDARDAYRQALAAAAEHAGFDPAQAHARLQVLGR